MHNLCNYRWREANPTGDGNIWRECTLEKDHEPPHAYHDGEHLISEPLALTGPELVAEHTGNDDDFVLDACLDMTPEEFDQRVAEVLTDDAERWMPSVADGEWNAVTAYRRERTEKEQQ